MNVKTEASRVIARLLAQILTAAMNVPVTMVTAEMDKPVQVSFNQSFDQRNTSIFLVLLNQTLVQKQVPKF